MFFSVQAATPEDATPAQEEAAVESPEPQNLIERPFVVDVKFQDFFLFFSGKFVLGSPRIRQTVE